MQDELLALIGRGIDAPRDDAEFNDLALRLFAYQFGANEPYRKYCERKGLTPANVARWNDVGVSTRFKPGEQVVVMVSQPAARSAKPDKAPTKKAVAPARTRVAQR